MPPEVYNSDVSYKPGDFSDVGQATILSKYFGSELRYSPATRYIRYCENYWQETEPGAQAVAQELTRRQLDQATNDLLSATKKLSEVGAQEILDNTSKSKAESLFNDEQAEAYAAFLAAKAYQSFSIKRRESKNITATLREAHPMLEITARLIDCFFVYAPPLPLIFERRTVQEALPETISRKSPPFRPVIKVKSSGGYHQPFCGDQVLIDYAMVRSAAIGKDIWKH